MVLRIHWIIHLFTPESYELAERIIGELGFTLKDLQDKSQLEALQVKLPLVDVDKMAHKLDAGIPTVRDIIAALAKPGRDPREGFTSTTYA